MAHSKKGVPLAPPKITAKDLDKFEDKFPETRGNHHGPNFFPSMKAAAFTLKLPIAVLKDARSRDCTAFRSGGYVQKQELLDWLAREAENGNVNTMEDGGDDNFEDTYEIPDEAGGVGLTLKSLQMAERRLKRKLDSVVKSQIHVALKAKLEKEALEAWLKVVGQLLKYDLAVDMAKRESGELIPIADAIAGVQALLAWHSVSMSDALRNVIPDCEGLDKYGIATILDTTLRSSIYRNFKLAVENHKIPEWMGQTVSEYSKAEKPLAKAVFADPIL